MNEPEELDYCTCTSNVIAAIDCPMHGDVVSPEAKEETTPELEEALASTKGELVSAPPPDAEPLPCRAHGSPFAKVTMKNEANWKVFEDGCEEPL